MELMHDELAEIEQEINEQLQKVRETIAQAKADKVEMVEIDVDILEMMLVDCDPEATILFPPLDVEAAYGCKSVACKDLFKAIKAD